MIRALFTLFVLSLAFAGHADARERNIMLTDFDRVQVRGAFAVTVKTGGNTGAIVSGDVHSVDGVDVHVEGRTLIITSNINDWGGWPGAREAPPTIAVTARSIDSADVVGGGTLTIDRVSGQRVDLSVAGAGSMKIAAIDADMLNANVVGTGTLTIQGGATGRARFTNNGAGLIDASALKVRDLTAISNGPGPSELRASQTADITVLGLGQVHVAGSAACRISGPGPARCDRKN